MSLTTSAQKFQAARMPVVDASLDEKDAYGFAGIIFPETTPTTLTSDQKKQFAGIPIVDASLDTKDGYAFARGPRTGGGGNQVEGFSLSWNIDPTWSVAEAAFSTDGAITRTIGSVITAFLGIVGDRPAGGPEGYGGESMYNSEAQRRKRRKERLKELQEEIRRINRWR